MNSRTLTTISQARIGRRQLPAVLTVPERPIGMVVFAHGSGSSRFSPRNQFVAHCLQQAGLATLLIDLLSERESSDRYNVFDIPLLAERVVESIEWTREHASTAELPVGIFGRGRGRSPWTSPQTSHQGPAGDHLYS
jgi:putative phosphoribosyl transferase